MLKFTEDFVKDGAGFAIATKYCQQYEGDMIMAGVSVPKISLIWIIVISLLYLVVYII